MLFRSIGETLNEKRKNKTNQVLAKQIKNCLKSINKKSDIIIAYEPVWSIGTGLIPKSDNLSKSISFIKNKFKLIYCPPNTLIRPLSKRLKNTNIEVGAQNSHENENSGPYTGHVNSKMLKNVGAKYVILGHSENRQEGENDKLINLKIKSSIKAGLKVIFCIG